MLDFTQSLFTEAGFRNHFYQVLKRFIEKPGYEFNFHPSKECDVYDFFVEGPSPKEIGRVYFYQDEDRTINSNLGSPLCEEGFKKFCVKEINKDHLALINKLTGTVDSNRKVFDKELHKAKAAINLLYLKKDFAWIAQRPYIMTQIDAIRFDLAKNISSLSGASDLPGNSIATLKWHGTLAKLCNVFFFISRESPDLENYFIDASREEIIAFIQTHFTKENGESFDRETIAKYLNPNQKDRHDAKIRRKVRNSPQE